MYYGIINTQSIALKDDNLIGLLINNRYNGTTMTNRNNTRHFVRGQSHMPLLLTTEDIIQRFKKTHGDKYDYSLVEHKGSDCYVDIICKTHGVFSQRADGHASGQNCPKCVKRHKPTNEEFVSKCKEMHGNKFIYQKTKYKNARTEIVVACSEHGEFSVLPFAHQNSKSGGCPKCNPLKKLTLEDFIEKSKIAHGDVYDYSKVDFKNVRGKVVIICPIHGEFIKIADHHLQGGGCQICAAEVGRQKISMGLDEFVRQANIFHNHKYDYSKVEYKNGYTKVEIICPIHGAFWQRPHGHLQTRGCKECGDESKFNFKRKEYIAWCEKSNNGLSNLYVIKCKKDDEVFYKVGVTLRSLKERFSGNLMPYDYEEIYFVTEKSSFVWDLENQIHKLLKPYSYRPIINFGGVTECYSEIPKDILKFIEGLRKTSQMQLIA